MHFTETLDQEGKRAEWRVERAGWAALLAFLIASGAGVFGTGPLSDEHATLERGDERYEVGYERWNRRDHVSLMVVRVHAPSASGEALSIALARELGESMTVRSTSPASDGGSLGVEGQVYHFQVDDWSQAVSVTFEYVPERLWRQEATITLTAGESTPVAIPFRQMIYP